MCEGHQQTSHMESSMERERFDIDPGLTVRVFLADIAPAGEDRDITIGTMVGITAGMFKGMVGHVHEIEDIGNAIVRQGEPWQWEGR
jgi:transcription antitermination factor NusG